MVKSSQNIIHSSSFNFEYGSKASATRCNILIESIFNSHILPELEKAISNSIPEGMLIELAKLEINLGRIDEKEISGKIAGRIGTSLEYALQSRFGIEKKSLYPNTSFERKISDNYLIRSIELFLQKGYFPYGMDQSFTIDELVAKAFHQNQNQKELKELIRRCARHDSSIRRIAYGFSTETFDLIVSELEPDNIRWIVNFRKILSSLSNERNLSGISENEFLRTINYFILKYLLNETGSVFNRKKFSGSILRKFILVFKVDSQVLLQAFNKNTGNSTAIILIQEALSKWQEVEGKPLSGGINQRFQIERLIEILNSGSNEYQSLKPQLLKDAIIQAIQNKEKRAILIERLSRNGVILILELFYEKNINELINLITSFTAEVANRSARGISGQKGISANHFVLFTVMYLNEKAIRRLDKEEYVLFLIYSAGLEDSKTVNTSAFKRFIQTQKDIDFKKMLSLIDDERKYPEISGIQKVLSKGQNHQPTQDDSPTDNTISEEYIAIYRKKIIGYYLDSGHLPDAFSDLNWSDVQTLFRNLIQQKDDFLAAKFRTNDDAEVLINRLQVLIGSRSLDDLEAYLIYFFRNEYVILSEIVDEIKQQFNFNSDHPIHSQTYRNQVFITALAASKGGSLAGVYLLSILENLNSELAGDSSDSEKLMHFLSLKSGDRLKTGNLPNKANSDAEYKKMIGRDYKLLFGRLRLTGQGIQPTRAEVQRLIKKFTFYFQADQKAILDVLQENRDDLLQIYTLLKFYLPSSQWKLVEQSLLSRTELKREIEKFQQHQDIISARLADPELDWSKTLEDFGSGDSEKLKVFLILIKSDEALFEKFISVAKDSEIPAILSFGNRTVQRWFHQLLSFSPGSLSGKIDRKFWKSLVLGFGMLIFPEEKEFGPKAFASAFFNHLLQKLNAINETEMYYPIVAKMNTKGPKELRELVEWWQVSKRSESGSKAVDESDHQNSLKEMNHSFSVLRFYGQNGFFPWWAGKLSFPELIAGLHRSSQLYSKTFEELFLRMEREEHIFEQLIPKIFQSVINEFDQLISGHVSLKGIWKKILQVNKKIAKSNSGSYAEQFIEKDSREVDSLFKDLYFKNDEEILAHWQKVDPQIANQIKEYVLLSPYFYFRNINPAQWRKTVYEFSLDYYGPEVTKVNNDFHAEFLKHLKTKHSTIDWDDTFKTVYKLAHSTKENHRVAFPKALIQLITVEPADHRKSNETGHQENNILSDEDDGIEVRISNAGLILFWPFLTRLFENLSLVKSGDFISPESMNRAVYILQYLGYFEIDFPEYNLILNKLMVGMQAQDHLVPVITLTDEEKEIAQSLFNGLINNWEKVKNSSPEGIQQTFIQREGILRFQKDKVSLVVVKKGVDILLDSIPWNISLIKLSWMKKPIYVEWM